MTKLEDLKKHIKSLDFYYKDQKHAMSKFRLRIIKEVVEAVQEYMELYDSNIPYGFLYAHGVSTSSPELMKQQKNWSVIKRILKIRKPKRSCRK